MNNPFKRTIYNNKYHKCSDSLRTRLIRYLQGPVTIFDGLVRTLSFGLFHTNLPLKVGGLGVKSFIKDLNKKEKLESE